MFGPGGSTSMWNEKNMASYLQEEGILQSFKFIGIDTIDENRVWVFKTIFSKVGTKATSLTLEKIIG